MNKVNTTGKRGIWVPRPASGFNVLYASIQKWRIWIAFFFLIKKIYMFMEARIAVSAMIKSLYQIFITVKHLANVCNSDRLGVRTFPYLLFAYNICIAMQKFNVLNSYRSIALVNFIFY